MPWRATKIPYKIWLSEIILQQTQVKQGLPYYKAFVKAFPTVFDLAKAPESIVLKTWQGLGYYSRARNLHFSAQYIVDELDGKFPSTYKDLLQLKGVGDYTASAMASICFNEVTPVVDGNVYRVLARYYGIKTPINSGKALKEFKAVAHAIIDKNNPAEFNQAIMEFGARQCKPKSPDCSVCPFNDGCYAFNKDEIENLPVKLKPAKVKKKYFNYLVFLSEDGKTLMEQRTKKGIWKNLYQFPLLETPKTLSKPQGEKRVKAHATALDVEGVLDVQLFNAKNIVHKLSHRHIFTKFWVIKVKNLPPSAMRFKEVHKKAVPVLISNFLETFDFSEALQQK